MEYFIDRRTEKTEHIKLNGRQSYFVDMPSNESAKSCSVISFEVVEKIGEPYRVTIQLSHSHALRGEDYLGKDAAFVIASPLDDVSHRPRRFSGCVTSFSRTAVTRDESRYELVIEAHLARLTLTRASRIYQHQSAPQIIEAILRRHGFNGHQFVFRLRRDYPQHAFRLQYQITDWDYIRVLMQQEGLFSYIVPGESVGDGDVVTFADDVDHYLYQPALSAPYREPSGLDAHVEAIHSLRTQSRTVTASQVVADVNPDFAHERIKGAAGELSDASGYGASYVYGTHHRDQQGAQWEALLRHEAAVAMQTVHAGASSIRELKPARVFRIDDPVDGSDDGLLIVEVTHRGARDQPYQNHFKAIPANRRFRLAIDDQSWPRVNGTLSARVTSPGGYRYAYLTSDGRYTVRFDLDFDTWNPGGESVPLRLAKPFAGSGKTGFHFPALDGTEAVIAFENGDPNRPYIAQFHHNSQQPDLIDNQQRWLSRNVVRTQGNNKLRFEDWAGEEGIKLSTGHSSKSQLNLGYLVDAERRKRGEGFELRTSDKGAIRAGKGIFISAHDQPQAAGDQLDMQTTITQLEDALALARSLAASAETARGIPIDTAAQRKTLEELKGLETASLLFSAPASVGVVAGHGVQIAARDSISAVAGGSAEITTAHDFTVAAGDAVSLFARKQGIGIVAGGGAIDVRANNDGMSLRASKDLTVSSENGVVRVKAARELVLECGGAFIRLADGNVTIGGPRNLLIKTIAMQKQGPASVQLEQQKFFESQAEREFSEQVRVDEALYSLAAQAGSALRYEVWGEGGTRIGGGVLDDSGKTLRAFTDKPEALTTVVDLHEGKWTALHFDAPYRMTGNISNNDLAGVFDYPDHDSRPDDDARDEAHNDITEEVSE
ncbi:type VI secretion system Vgr family protein [Paraburkholderia sp.]|uniref:type VI secretion system Vgr family protein n=1 Tax=Paraburkholderia sp. TaxID=1926495 RepID=UPI002394FF5F|nr:type VI secretion system Vgr family protein [Paraburkholderia sp.]MDE1180308.1 type VI secretion system tip protein VgrG [Paraburkholderia sp.]